MNFLPLWLYLASGAANFALGVLVIAQQPRRPTARAFFLIATGVALWTASVALLYASHDEIFGHLAFAGGTIAVLGIALFSSALQAENEAKRTPRAQIASLLLALAVTPFDLFIRDHAIGANGSLAPVNGPLMSVYALVVGGNLLWSIARLLLRYHRTLDAARAQLQYFLLGLAILAGNAILFDLVLPLFGVFSLNALGPLSSVAFAGLTAYALLGRHLLNIRVAIQRGAIYAAVAVGVTCIYFFGLFVLTNIMRETVRLSSIASGAIATTLGVLLFPAVERLLRKATDPFFFKNGYDYGEALRTLSATLNGAHDLGEMRRRTVAELTRIFRTERVRLVLFGDGSPRKEAESPAALTVPVSAEGERIGLIALEKKRSGDAYTANDMRLLETFANQAGVALKKAELYQKLREHSEMLEERVRERTAEVHALREAERRTLSDISHAVQTPLTILKGEIESMRKSRRPPKAFARIARSADEISRLAYAMTDLAKLERADALADAHDIDLSEIAENVAEYVAVISKTHRITLKKKIVRGIIMRGDRARLEEMLTNLLSNAVRHMGRSRNRTIFLGLRRSAGNIVLEVQDTGPGIPPEHLPRIFDRFYRVPGGNQATDGSGLGLQIAQRIAIAHGGKIDVISEIGKGSTFRVMFGVEKEEESEIKSL